jgi:hypothetical protein
MITGLPIDGEPVTEPEHITSEECYEHIGITPNNGNLVDNGDLIEKIRRIKDTSTDLKVKKTCRAIALLGISCTIMQGIRKSKIHTRYLSFLKDVDKIKLYAWGAASLNFHDRPHWIFFETQRLIIINTIQPLVFNQIIAKIVGDILDSLFLLYFGF